MILRGLSLIGCMTLGIASEPPVPPAPEALRIERADPRLTAKAPHGPTYGLVMDTPKGKLLVTHLIYDPQNLNPTSRWYRVWGPAGWGPYRSGFEGHLGIYGKVQDPSFHPVWRQNHFSAQGTPKGCPADRAGLDVTSPFFAIDRVDGSTFDWDPQVLTYHITQRPTIEVEAIKLPIFFGPSHTRRTVVNQRISQPPDPADAELIPVEMWSEMAKAILKNPDVWKQLLIARSQQPAWAPLAFTLEGTPHWAVLAPGALPADPKAPVPLALEIWKTNPLEGDFLKGILGVLPGTPEGPRRGALLLLGTQWYVLQDWARSPETGALARLELRPWEPDIQALLAGSRAAATEALLDAAQRESLEQAANEALLAYKTLRLPKDIGTLDETALGQLVLRIEKGLLVLDLDVKGLRSRLDAAARAQAEWKAQADLAAKSNQRPPTPPPPCTETERLGDLLEQRKAILMAILGTAKQAFAQVRR